MHSAGIAVVSRPDGSVPTEVLRWGNTTAVVHRVVAQQMAVVLVLMGVADLLSDVNYVRLGSSVPAQKPKLLVGSFLILMGHH